MGRVNNDGGFPSLWLLSSVCLIAALLSACSPPGAPEPLDRPANEMDSVGNEDAGDDWEAYHIEAGQHHSDQRRLALFRGDRLHFKFRFDSSAVYHTQDPQNQADWNKLLGFSDCGDLHQQSSFRLVWRWYRGQLELGEYRYAKGAREFSLLDTLQIARPYGVEVLAKGSSYVINFQGQQFERARPCDAAPGRYWLFPYFGGDEPAPQQIAIQIQLLP